MSATLEALTPIVTLIVLGGLARASGWLGEGFWPAAEKLTYYLLLPALLVASLARGAFADVSWPALLVATYLPLLLTAAVLLAGRRWLVAGGDAGQFTSVFQGGIRFNTYIGLALATALFGGTGRAQAALIAGLMIVLVNVLSVAVLTLASPGRHPARVPLALAGNPLILGCLIGGLLNILGLPPTGALRATLAILGDAALPLGLLCVGASLRLGRLRSAARPLVVASLAKFALKPALAFAACWALAIAPPLASVLVVFMALPTAPSSYILARQMGGDHALMAAIISGQTVLAFLTLPLTLWLLRLA